ncbi:helix-turn-helix domain-containing protein [Streptomyces sp. NPDC092296]|uniref:helix-turn-helix domain-containing protein n=1 Tax=Streptomyces sp. NPDC092296 TaxID=3366012 RepID=UPI003811C034
MYDMATRRRAVELYRRGHSLSEIGRRTGISRSAIRQWTVRISPLSGMRAECPVNAGVLDRSIGRGDYAYLLGLYLGDGCISPAARGVHALRISCGNCWPGLIDLCAGTVRAVLPGNSVSRVRAAGCTQVVSFSKHWPCLFPQHGPGKKHERRIALTQWQQDIVGAEPWPFIRGLVHSDGCRITNWTTRSVAGVPRRYEYPRYFFTNTSEDIVGLYTGTLDAVGVAWTAARRGGGAVNVSVARRASVALMDRYVGAKH